MPETVEHTTQKTKPPRIRGKKGALKNIVNMPHDIILEICQHLSLRDLLNLSRTNKAFGVFLSGQNMMQVWKVAASNVEGLPACPPYMNEIQYARLLYLNYCHKCGKSNVRNLFHEWSVRYCQGCVPMMTVKVRNERRFLRQIEQATGVEKPFCQAHKRRLHAPTVEAFRKKWDELEGDKEGRKKLARDSAADAAVRREHAHAHDLWLDNIEEARKDKEMALKAARLKAIEKGVMEAGIELKQLAGWGYQLSEQPFADKTAPLAEPEWSSIRKEVTGYVSLMKLQDLLDPLIKSFLDVIPRKWEEKWAQTEASGNLDDSRAFARMRPADLLLLPEVKEAIMSGVDDLVVLTHLNMPKDELHPIIERSYFARAAALNQMIRQARPTFPKTARPVNLAVCMFDCADPRCPEKFMHYPQVLEHRCKWNEEYWRYEVPVEDYVSVVQSYMVSNCLALAWHKHHVRVSPLAYTPAVQAIVRAFELDPEFASPRDLDRCEMRIICADCAKKDPSEKPKLEVYDWRRAIFSFLHPRDLLNLARTSPAFRVFLMSRSSAHFWKSARQNVGGLPDLPPYLSEPEYANLMFFPYCHSCSTTNIQNIIFEFSARYCSQCKKVWLGKYNPDFYYLVDMARRITGIDKDVLNFVFVMGKDDVQDAYIHCAEYDALRIALEAAYHDIEEVKKVVEEKAAAVEVVQQSCVALYAWKEMQVLNRANELHGVRTERFNTLLDFLRQDGWSEELDVMHEDDYTALSETPYARKAVKLTPRTWLKIKEDAHAFMDDVRTTRLRGERRTVLQNRFALLDSMISIYYGPPEVLRRAEWDTHPNFVDLALTRDFREVWDAPGDGPVELTASDLDSVNISVSIELTMEDWKAALKAELIAKVRAAIPELAEAEDPLSLAIAGFSCRTCGGYARKRVPPLRFPSILAHRCLRPSPQIWSGDVYIATASTFCNSGPLSLQGSGHGEQQILVQVEAFDWMRALGHHNDTRHIRNSARPCRWRALEADEARSVRRQETRLWERPSALESQAADSVRRFGCRYCRYNCDGASSMVSHLRKHDKNVDVAGVGQHAYEHLDNKPFMLPIWVNYRVSGGYFTFVEDGS
ncbi:hypothetical protein TRAPUB_3015 [Trametes pubescens]|uniref:F-box domain-containing protein n=1 Tax=Trametes pubescens TaxID=154538 RepID=A0A1M2VET1_TRAPU|nr:hypothetical protein TRAPUB_3015 [Trametes pubescens]